MSTHTKSKNAPKAEAAKTAPKAGEAKAAPKVEAAKAAPNVQAAKAASKAEETKAAPKAEEAKPAPKVEEVKPAPKVEEVKAAPRVEEVAVKMTAESYEQVVTNTKAQVEKANEAVAKGYSDLASLQKESMDALVTASRIWAKGAEDIGKACIALAQETAEANSEAARAFLSAKSLKEIMELQNELARKNFDKSLNESARLSELSLKVANEAFQPLQKQFTAAFEKARNVA